MSHEQVRRTAPCRFADGTVQPQQLVQLQQLLQQLVLLVLLHPPISSSPTSA
jgi:hypothetical protein